MINNKSIGRKLKELLQQNDVAMISICEDDINTSTANGLFMFNLKVNLAEHELKKGSERIKAVFEYKVAQGQPITKHYAELATEKYLLSNLDALLKDHIATISSITSETKDTTEKELKELRKELDNLNYIFIKKRMPVSTYERLYAETEDKIKRLESFKPQSTDHLNQFLNSGWRSIYENLTRENKRTLWRNVLDSVHVSPDGIEVFFK